MEKSGDLKNLFNARSLLDWLRCFVCFIGCALLGCVHQSPTPAKLEFWLGGDVHFGTTTNSRVLTAVGPVVGQSVGIVNLEGPLGEVIPSGRALYLANSESNLNSLREAGVKIVGVANNHALDLEVAGLAKTVAGLKKNGFLPMGGPAGRVVYEQAGLKIALVAYNLTEAVPPDLEADLKAARAASDLLMVTFHVTGPPSYLPRPELKKAVEVAVGAGASVVAAHGTHAIGPVERRGGTVIAWGLGNLAFNCDCTQETEALLLLVSIENKQVSRAAVVPVTAGLQGKPTQPAKKPAGTFDLLEAIGSPRLQRAGDRAFF